MKKMTRKKTAAKKKVAKKTTARRRKPVTIQVADARGLSGDALLGTIPVTIQESFKDAVRKIGLPLMGQEAKILGLNYDAITTAVANALKKRDDAIMAELGKIEAMLQRIEEIVAVVERSEILITKIVGFCEANVTVQAGELYAADVPACVASAVAEIRAQLLPDAYAVPATDRMGREVVVYASRESNEIPFLVDCIKPASEIQESIMQWAQYVVRERQLCERVGCKNPGPHEPMKAAEVKA